MLCLYASNTFVGNPDVVQSLPRFILPQRMNSIRSFGFELYLGSAQQRTKWDNSMRRRRLDRHEYKKWINIWRTLAKMESFQELHVSWLISRTTWNQLSMLIIRELLEPLMKITTLKYFELNSAMDKEEEIVVPSKSQKPFCKNGGSQWDMPCGPVACCCD
jgi:hypothetical protein